MYDSSKLEALTQFARVRAGAAVMDVWPGGGDWTRRFSDIVGPEGRVYSFVPSELPHFKSDPLSCFGRGQKGAHRGHGAS